MPTLSDLRVFVHIGSDPEVLEQQQRSSTAADNLMSTSWKQLEQVHTPLLVYPPSDVQTIANEGCGCSYHHYGSLDNSQAYFEEEPDCHHGIGYEQRDDFPGGEFFRR